MTVRTHRNVARLPNARHTAAVLTRGDIASDGASMRASYGMDISAARDISIVDCYAYVSGAGSWEAEMVRTSTLARARRTAAKLIRYTPDELALVTDRARACGRPVACYVRECSLGAVPKERRAHRDAEVIRALARIGNILADLTRAADTDSLTWSTEVQTALEELLATIRRIE